MRVPRLLITLVALTPLVLGGCHQLNDDSSGSVLSAQTDPVDPPSVCTDPCAGDTIFGPETFNRTTCEPVTEVRSFVLPDAGDVCIVVSNAGASSAWIRVNGIKYIRPNGFNPGVTDITETVSLPAGTHELSVRVASAPGTSVTVELRACDEGPPPQRLCSEVAREFCESKGWIVVSEPNPPIGNIVCTVDGRDSSENCSTCTEYNMVVWQDGSPEQHCVGTYSTLAGHVYGGHIPCLCADNLYYCQGWDMQNCIPD